MLDGVRDPQGPDEAAGQEEADPGTGRILPAHGAGLQQQSRLAHRRLNPANRRETLLELTDARRLAVENVTARRHQEIASIVERMEPEPRAALVEALTAFNEAGGEPPATPAGSPTVCPLGWADAPASHVV
ncbi:hypothetical protein [Streptomyces sp. YIM 121038]|uniref:hypothetical protein n=1 Tax=Streptomyces sp. YIM 121038 TaxID=2136401 RepID=UPI001BB2C19F|nr:hypothetical protein [Streptomyces sp. YIM 121038]